MNVLGMGPLELLLIAALALIVVGPSKLPDLARQLGRVVGDLRRMSSEVKNEFRQSVQVEEPTQHTPVIRPSPPPSPSPPRPASQDDLRPPY